MSGISILDWIIIAAYFVLTIIIGQMATKKVNTTKDYLVGGRKVGKFQSAISTAAADIGGSSLIGAAGLSYTIGIAGGWWNLSAVPAWIILGLTMAGGFRKLALTTVPELFEKRYDKKTRIIAAIATLLNCSLGITAQILVAGIAFTTLTGLPMVYTVIVSASVFVFYTSTGGLLAVIWTDIMHYFVLMGGILIAILIGIPKIGGWNHLVNTVPHSYWNLGAMGWSDPIGWVALCFFAYATNQQYIQRLFAAKDESTARFAYIYTGVNYIFYAFIISIIGMIAFVITPGLKDSQMALPTVITNVLPIGVKGLLLAAILSASMNCASSSLNSATAIFSIDIYKRFLNKDVDDKKLLKISRIATVCIAVGALTTSYFIKNIVHVVVLSGLISGAGMFFPIILGVNNKRVNAYGGFWAIVVGSVIAVTDNYLWYNKLGGLIGHLHPMILGSIISLVVLLIVSYITPPPTEEKLKFLECLDKSVVETETT
ncbi:sodium:solute symporter family protein [Clostridium sp. PL3]|uniref:Sodium:solute symporter family protein n=1 Tax=Clostridium thailandense TaxID=2794346 RepID=A0A949TWF8_9CLOT|nr:sodium:solute symporter family protein [Clostridium thailandense]MBV7276597.1 sodium:solute symporter family protein [Clostridium thailandense]